MTERSDMDILDITGLPADPPPIQAGAALNAILATEADLNTRYIDRSDAIRAALMALVTKQHMVMLSEPGLAKSGMIRDIAAHISDSTYFEALLSRNLPDSSVLGPYDIAALKDRSEFIRKDDGKLTSADISFLDEALALDTPLPTPTGWTTVGDVRPGTELLGRNGQVVLVKDLTSVRQDSTCFRIHFKDGTSIVADAGHQWLATSRHTGKNAPLKVRRTSELEVGSRIPLPKPLEFSPASIPCDPYLLGAWLGNGHPHTAAITVRRGWEAAILDYAKNHGVPEARVSEFPSKEPDYGAVQLHLTGGFRAALNQLGLVQNYYEKGQRLKRVPDIVLRASKEQRIKFIQGMMDTDGYLDKAGVSSVFSTSIRQVAEAMAEILRTLGCQPTVRRADKPGYGEHYKVTFSSTFCPFLLRTEEPGRWRQPKRAPMRRITAIEQVDSVPVRCIELEGDDPYFLAGTAMAVTHNCFKASATLLNSLLAALNERIAYDPHRTIPLRSVFMASNESWHAVGEEVRPFWDRTLFRVQLRGITNGGDFERLLTLDHPEIVPTLTLGLLDQAHEEVQAVNWPQEMSATLWSVAGELKKENILTSPRRWRQVVTALKAAAWFRGDTEVSSQDLPEVTNCLWEELDQLPAVTAILTKAADPVAGELAEISKELADLKASATRAESMEGNEANKENLAVLRRSRRLASNLSNLTLTGKNAQAQKDKLAEELAAFDTRIVSALAN